MEGDSSHFTRYLLGDPFMRFYFGFLRPLQKKSRQREHYFTNFAMPSARFRSWLGLAFELLCLQHQDVIAKILGFSGAALKLFFAHHHDERLDRSARLAVAER